MHKTKHISISIQRTPSEIYDFASNPENLPKWAAGLSGATVKVKFAHRNEFGVMDHDVTLPSGEVNHNPFRVISNGEVGEVVFTLFHLPRMTDSEFEADAKLIEKDLETLKALLER